MATDDIELDEETLFPAEPAHFTRATHRKRRSRAPDDGPTTRPVTPRLDRQAIIVVAVVAGLMASLGSARPNGYVVGDIAMRLAFGVLLTLATARARRWSWLWLAGVSVLAASRAVAVVPAGIGVAVGFVTVVVDSRRRLWGAVIGALAAQALVRLPDTELYGLQTVLVLLAVVPVAVSAYRISPRRIKRRVHRTLVGGAAVVALGAVVLTALVVFTASDVDDAVADARRGLEAARDGDDQQAATSLRSAADSFEHARSMADSWWMTPARLVPGMSQHALAYETAAGQGADVTEAGASVAETIDVDLLRLEGGRLNLSMVEDAQAPLAANADALDEAADELAEVDYGWLVGPLGSRLTEFRDEVDATLPSARLASDLADVAPALLGADGPRRYFVIFTQPAEARGSGGFMGSWAEITAVDGDLELTRSGRTEEIRDTPGYDERTITGPVDYVRRYGASEPWKVLQDVTLSPDFPSVAEVMGQVYPQTGGDRIDGVIALDPYGLAALMEFTGPIRVEGLDRPLTADDAAEFLLRDQYLEFQEDEGARRDWLEDAGRETFDALTRGDLPSPREVAEVLDPVVDEGRLVLWSAHPDEQAIFEELGIDGAMPSSSLDLFGVVTQNNANNKIDVFLERSVDYDVVVDPATGEATATATVSLTNTLPSLDYPDAIVANNDQGYPLGTNRAWVNLYSPLRLVEARIDGERTPLGTGREFGLWVYDGFVDLAPGQTVEIVLDLAGNLGPFDRYELVVPDQPLPNPDEVSVTLSVTPGWRIEDGRGLIPSVDGEQAEITWTARRDRTLHAEVDRR